MNCGKQLIHALLLTSGIGLAAPGSAATAAALAPSYSDNLTPATVVLRGSTAVVIQRATVDDDATAVLRGSPPSAAHRRPDARTCRVDEDYDPSYGCAPPSYADTPYGYGYWPYYGFDGFFSSGQRPRLNHGFTHAAGRGVSVGFAHHPLMALGHPLARFGRR
jgi:hypothetical protein